MTKKVISYKLNSDGTTPEYVAYGGYLAKNPNSTADMILIGISKDEADTSGAISEFSTEAETLAWVNTYLSDYFYTDHLGNQVQFVVADAISDIFAKL
ncbi:MAG: hypothetical protein FJ356_05960 [Thaumarchaeota archaeon]|nr:hypothetical protein [Nitrososphaerota archaeon]